MYQVGETVNERLDLSEEKIVNIDLMFHRVLGKDEQGNDKFKVMHQVSEENRFNKTHPLVSFNQEIFIDDTKQKNIGIKIKEFANLLLAQELIEENGKLRRRKNIKEGLLFVKYIDSQKLVLLKLEETVIINPIDFSPIDGLSMDNQYYKACIFVKNDFENVTIVDRNTSVAKYWARDFLNLERKRDNYTNTQGLIKDLESGALFSKSVRDDEKLLKSVTQQVRGNIFNSAKFDKETYFQLVKDLADNTDYTSSDIFSDATFDKIDIEFELDQKAIAEKYNHTLRVSKRLKIVSDNFIRDKQSKMIKLTGNKLTINVSEEYLDDVRKSMKEI